MKFLVVTVSNAAVPPDVALGLLDAMRGWAERNERKMDALWGFAGQPGGCGIVNVDTAEELDEIMTTMPFAPFSKIDIYPLTDLKKSLNTAATAFSAMATA